MKTGAIIYQPNDLHKLNSFCYTSFIVTKKLLVKAF